MPTPGPVAKKTSLTPTLSGGGLGGIGGLIAAGPVGLAIGAVVGAAVGYAYGTKLAKDIESVIPPSAMQLITGATGATSTQLPHVANAQVVASTGKAKSAAAALYGYLKANGANGSPELTSLITQFQSVSNTDPDATMLTGPLPVTAKYDVKTAAALTIYTSDPIPPATPPAPSPPPLPSQMNIGTPGAVATSGFTLHQYLKVHGNNPTDGSLKQLVQQFQLDFNSDPKGPGPAASYPFIPLIKTPLAVTGIYGAPEAKALSILSGDTINP